MTRAGRIESLLLKRHSRKVKYSLDRIKEVLKRFDNPQEALPPTIHVAGTNGKGSTMAFLRGILEAAGYRGHSFTSPSLTGLEERFTVRGETIKPSDLEEVLLKVSDESFSTGIALSFFEVLAVSAFIVFREKEGDFVLLESGLGGRLDATNVVSAPVLTILTSISLDHTDFLGESLEEIAREKCGILKEQVPIICGRQCSRRVEEIIVSTSAAKGSRLYREGTDWFLEGKEEGLTVRTPWGDFSFSSLGLLGSYQKENAGGAVLGALCLQEEGFCLPRRSLSEGLKCARWRGRFERIKDHLVYPKMQTGTEIIVDGGHNPSAAQAVVESLQEMRGLLRLENRPLIVLIGALKSKPIVEMLLPFFVFGSMLEVWHTPLLHQESWGSLPPLPEGVVREYSSLSSALDFLKERRDSPLVVVFGSLYLVSEFFSSHMKS